LIVVNSGDGTIQAVLTVLLGQQPFESQPLLALLNGGTTNMTHQDLGVGGPPVRALRRVIDWVHHGIGPARICRRTILKVRTASIAQPLYGLFFGAACIFNGIRFFHSRMQRMGLRGDTAHLLIVARFLWALARRDDTLAAPLSAAIRTGRLKTAQTGRYLLLLATTLDRLILGLRPFQPNGEGPLKLTAVAVRPRNLLKVVPFLMRGRPHPCAQPENGYFARRAHAIRLDMDGGFAVDGELFSADRRSGPVLIEAGGSADFLRL
jgi:hypothetical protein